MVESLHDQSAQVVLFTGKGRKPKERSVVLVNGERRIYYGFLPEGASLSQPGRIIKKLQEAADIPAVRQIANSYLVDSRDMEMFKG